MMRWKVVVHEVPGGYVGNDNLTGRKTNDTSKRQKPGLGGFFG